MGILTSEHYSQIKKPIISIFTYISKIKLRLLWI